MKISITKGNVMKKYLIRFTQSSIALALFSGWGAVSVNMQEADAISDVFDVSISTGMSEAHAEWVTVSSYCQVVYTGSHEQCLNGSMASQWICTPYYEWFPDDSSDTPSPYYYYYPDPECN